MLRHYKRTLDQSTFWKRQSTIHSEKCFLHLRRNDRRRFEEAASAAESFEPSARRYPVRSLSLVLISTVLEPCARIGNSSMRERILDTIHDESALFICIWYPAMITVALDATLSVRQKMRESWCYQPKHRSIHDFACFYVPSESVSRIRQISRAKSSIVVSFQHSRLSVNKT
jgi:hypothetical protein